MEASSRKRAKARDSARAEGFLVAQPAISFNFAFFLVGFTWLVFNVFRPQSVRHLFRGDPKTDGLGLECFELAESWTRVGGASNFEAGDSDLREVAWSWARLF